MTRLMPGMGGGMGGRKRKRVNRSYRSRYFSPFCQFLTILPKPLKVLINQNEITGIKTMEVTLPDFEWFKVLKRSSVLPKNMLEIHIIGHSCSNFNKQMFLPTPRYLIVRLSVSQRPGINSHGGTTPPGEYSTSEDLVASFSFSKIQGQYWISFNNDSIWHNFEAHLDVISHKSAPKNHQNVILFFILLK